MVKTLMTLCRATGKGLAATYQAYRTETSSCYTFTRSGKRVVQDPLEARVLTLKDEVLFRMGVTKFDFSLYTRLVYEAGLGNPDPGQTWFRAVLTITVDINTHFGNLRNTFQVNRVDFGTSLVRVSNWLTRLYTGDADLLGFGEEGEKAGVVLRRFSGEVEIMKSQFETDKSFREAMFARRR